MQINKWINKYKRLYIWINIWIYRWVKFGNDLLASQQQPSLHVELDHRQCLGMKVKDEWLITKASINDIK